MTSTIHLRCCDGLDQNLTALVTAVEIVDLDGDNDDWRVVDENEIHVQANVQLRDGGVQKQPDMIEDDAARSVGGRLSAERRRWDADILLCNRMLWCLLANRYTEAEEIASQGIAQAPLPVAVEACGDRFRDMSGTFCMIRALIETSVRAAEMERDNLSAALPGLHHAEALLSNVEPWVASHLMRGVCEIVIGVVHCMQHNFVKGGWHLLKAYTALRHLNIADMLDFVGMERPVVRSLALYFLGTKALILDAVPPAVTRWFPGFVGTGSRVKGLAMLRQCVAEKGFFQPLAMDALLTYHVAKEAWVQVSMPPPLPFLSFPSPSSLPLSSPPSLPPAPSSPPQHAPPGCPSYQLFTEDDWREIDEILSEADVRFGRTSIVFGHKVRVAGGHVPAFNAAPYILLSSVPHSSSPPRRFQRVASNVPPQLFAPTSMRKAAILLGYRRDPLAALARVKEIAADENFAR